MAKIRMLRDSTGRIANLGKFRSFLHVIKTNYDDSPQQLRLLLTGGFAATAVALVSRNC